MSAMVHRMLKAPVFTHMSHMRSVSSLLVRPNKHMHMHGTRKALTRGFAQEADRSVQPPPPPPESNKEFYVRWGIVGFFSLVITWVYLMPRNDYSAIGDKDTYIVDEKGPRKL
mmetsp:Transcript_6184/g.13653  ORF Transcript_6184/g.13653 Transcript_6184/m.13653 type:complete len:113 (+) Transcript_6184:124-462(+)